MNWTSHISQVYLLKAIIAIKMLGLWIKTESKCLGFHDLHFFIKCLRRYNSYKTYIFCRNHFQITIHYQCFIIKRYLNKHAQLFCNPLSGNLESLHKDLSIKANKIKKNGFKSRMFKKKTTINFPEIKLYNVQTI